MRHCIPVCSFICLMHNMVYVISICRKLPFLLFFFQAEDGIRDHCVTGVISYAVFCLRSEEHTSELQSHSDLVCRLLLEKKKEISRGLGENIMVGVCWEFKVNREC